MHSGLVTSDMHSRLVFVFSKFSFHEVVYAQVDVSSFLIMFFRGDFACSLSLSVVHSSDHATLVFSEI